MESFWKWGVIFEEKCAKALTTGFRSDLKIILTHQNTKTEFNLHKIFLQMGSPVLDNKIRNFLLPLPTDQNKVNQLEINNADPDIFKLMIKHFYSGKSGANMGQALRLLQLAKEYEVKDLMEECGKLLNKELTEENVLNFFEEQMLFANKPTIERTLNFICRNASEVLQRDEIKDMRMECLMEIIKQDSLAVENEIEIFDAVYRWGEAECERKSLNFKEPKVLRKVLDKLLNHVRFPLMTPEDFALKVGTKNLLEKDEQMALLMCFLVPPEQRQNLPVGKFISTPRKIDMEDSLSKSFVVSREVDKVLTFQSGLDANCNQQPFATNERLSLVSNVQFILDGLIFHKKSFRLQGTFLQYSQLYSYQEVVVKVTLTIKNTGKQFHLNCSLTPDENYLTAYFETDQQISVMASNFIDLVVTFSGKIIYNEDAYDVNEVLSIGIGYGYTMGQTSGFHSVFCAKGINFKIKKDNYNRNKEITRGFINAFIVSY